jgi:dTDP-4-dehydrorhamnose 3,5-epimerase
MKFKETRLAGVFVIELERHRDSRGFFARSFCSEEFAAHGLPRSFVQCSISYNRRRGTIRGLHYQASPRAEGKLVRVTHGSIFDIILDLRPSSQTYCEWMSVELSDDNRRAVYIPPGFAHGFQTLTDTVELFYQMTEHYDPAAARGVRWNDPTFAITWPIDSPTLSERDATYRNFQRS